MGPVMVTRTRVAMARTSAQEITLWHSSFVLAHTMASKVSQGGTSWPRRCFLEATGRSQWRTEIEREREERRKKKEEKEMYITDGAKNISLFNFDSWDPHRQTTPTGRGGKVDGFIS